MTNPAGSVRVRGMKTELFLVCLMFAWFVFSINQDQIGNDELNLMEVKFTYEEVMELVKTLKLN